MVIGKVVNSVFGSCSYLVDDGGDGVWLVDCGDVGPVVELLLGRKVRGVLLTHAHFDHIYGLNELCELYPKVLVYTNADGREALLDAKLNLSKYHEAPFVFSRPENIRLVDDGDCIHLYDSNSTDSRIDSASGAGLAAEVYATSGHNPSCLTYVVGNDVFTGDAYIPGVKVVTNIPGSDKLAAARSLKLIQALSVGKTIRPGHYIE